MPKNNEIFVKGIILEAYPQGEYGRRCVLLTDKFGKITAFAGGAAKSSSRIIGSIRPLTAAEFTLSRGRSAWNIHSAKVMESFAVLTTELETYACASYVLELAGYFSAEGMDEHEARDLLNLIYVTLDALRGNYTYTNSPGKSSAMSFGKAQSAQGKEDCKSPGIKDSFGGRNKDAGIICRIYELRLLVLQGEYTVDPGYMTFPGDVDRELFEKTNRLWKDIIRSPLTKLYGLTASLDQGTLCCFSDCVDVLFKKQVPHDFRSLQILRDGVL